MVTAALPAVPSVMAMATEFARRLMASRKGRERGGEVAGGEEEDMVEILQGVGWLGNRATRRGLLVALRVCAF